MASVLLKRCTNCQEYTLQEACPRCGAPAKPSRPAKFSPEDLYGDYRRKLKRLDQAEGAARLPPAQPPAGPQGTA
jgi:H/ACA ribonucleoprotein complex subunit 3